jgi:hypothetical protein
MIFNLMKYYNPPKLNSSLIIAQCYITGIVPYSQSPVSTYSVCQSFVLDHIYEILLIHNFSASGFFLSFTIDVAEMC